MGFFKDLFGPRQPCELCRLGRATWPGDRSVSADWKIRGHGLTAMLAICVPCRRAVLSAGLDTTNPLVALSLLVRSGHAIRPPAHAYLQHPEWRKIWMHTLDTADLRVSDEFAALAAIKAIEPLLLDHGSTLDEALRRARAAIVDEDDDFDLDGDLDDEVEQDSSNKAQEPTLEELSAQVDELIQKRDLENTERQKYATKPGVCPQCGQPIAAASDAGIWDGIVGGGAIYAAVCQPCGSRLLAYGRFGESAENLIWRIEGR